MIKYIIEMFRLSEEKRILINRRHVHIEKEYSYRMVVIEANIVHGNR